MQVRGMDGVDCARVRVFSVDNPLSIRVNKLMNAVRFPSLSFAVGGFFLCVRVCAVCAYVRVRMRVHPCVHGVCVCVCMRMCACACVRMRAHACACVCACCVCVCVHAYVCVCMCVHVHALSKVVYLFDSDPRTVCRFDRRDRIFYRQCVLSRQRTQWRHVSSGCSPKIVRRHP